MCYDNSTSAEGFFFCALKSDVTQREAGSARAA